MSSRRKRSKKYQQSSCSSKNLLLVDSYTRYKPTKKLVDLYCRSKPNMKEFVSKEFANLSINPYKPVQKSLKNVTSSEKNDINTTISSYKNQYQWIGSSSKIPNIASTKSPSRQTKRMLQTLIDFINENTSILQQETNCDIVRKMYNTAQNYEQLLLLNIAFLKNKLSCSINYEGMFGDPEGDAGKHGEASLSLILLHLFGVGTHDGQAPECEVVTIKNQLHYYEQKGYVCAYLPAILTGFNELINDLLACSLIYVIIDEKQRDGNIVTKTNMPDHFEIGRRGLHQSNKENIHFEDVSGDIREKIVDRYTSKTMYENSLLSAFDESEQAEKIVEPLQLSFIQVYNREYCAYPGAEDILLYYVIKNIRQPLFSFQRN